MATPLGPRLLGVPEATIQQHRLSEVVGSMAAHNQQQAAMQCMMSCLSTLHDMAKQQQQHDEQGPRGPGPQEQAPRADEQQQQAAPSAAKQEQGAEAAQAAAAACAAESPASDAAAAAGSAAGGMDPDMQHARAALAASEAEAALQYCRRLAAAALWVALSAKQAAEDPSVGGARLGRLLAKTFLHQSSALTSAVDAAGLGSLPRAQHQVRPAACGAGGEGECGAERRRPAGWTLCPAC